MPIARNWERLQALLLHKNLDKDVSVQSTRKLSLIYIIRLALAHLQILQHPNGQLSQIQISVIDSHSVALLHCYLATPVNITQLLGCIHAYVTEIRKIRLTEVIFSYHNDAFIIIRYIKSKATCVQDTALLDGLVCVNTSVHCTDTHIGILHWVEKELKCFQFQKILATLTIRRTCWLLGFWFGLWLWITPPPNWKQRLVRLVQ